jgi:hypothetical protein
MFFVAVLSPIIFKLISTALPPKYQLIMVYNELKKQHTAKLFQSFLVASV